MGSSLLLGRRVGALSDIQEYLRKTEELTLLDPELQGRIDEENVKLLVGKVMPLPKTLRETMQVSFDKESFESYDDTHCTLSVRLETEKSSLSRMVIDFSELPNFSAEEGSEYRG
jgi:hypothetical protein